MKSVLKLHAQVWRQSKNVAFGYRENLKSEFYVFEFSQVRKKKKKKEIRCLFIKIYEFAFSTRVFTAMYTYIIFAPLPSRICSCFPLFIFCSNSLFPGWSRAITNDTVMYAESFFLKKKKPSRFIVSFSRVPLHTRTERSRTFIISYYYERVRVSVVHEVSVRFFVFLSYLRR